MNHKTLRADMAKLVQAHRDQLPRLFPALAESATHDLMDELHGNTREARLLNTAYRDFCVAGLHLSHAIDIARNKIDAQGDK